MLPDFWKSKIQDTGGGNSEEDLLANSILEQRFNEAERKSMEYNKKPQEEINFSQKIDDIVNEDLITEDTNFDEESLNEVNKMDLNKFDKNEILEILTKKTPMEIKNIKETIKSEANSLKENKVETEPVQKVGEKNEKEKNSVDGKSINKTLKTTNEIFEKENIDNINKNIVINTITSKNKKKEMQKVEVKKEISTKKEIPKSEPLIIKFEQKKPKKEESLSIKFEEKKSKKEESQILKFEEKKLKKEDQKKEEQPPQVIKFENKKLRKDESEVVVSKDFKEENTKDEILSLKRKTVKEDQKKIVKEDQKKIVKEDQKKAVKEDQKKIVKEDQKKTIKDDQKNKSDNIVNQNNIFEILPETEISTNSNSNESSEEKKKNELKNDKEINNENELSISTVEINPIVTSLPNTINTKKNKKKSKHKKKKAAKESIEENIDLINKELNINEKQANNNKETGISNEKKENEGTGSSKKKKKSKKKNNDIELHILTVKDSKTQLMKETQLYRLPLTAIARKLIPDDSGTTLGLKPLFPPDIEIEALCNVIVKRSKKKKRDNINLPFFKTKIGQLKSELEDDKIDFNYIDEVDENIILEGSPEHLHLMEQKQLELLKSHNMEVNMISSLKQIKRRNLKNMVNKAKFLNEIELGDEENLEDGELIENLSEEFIDEEDIDDIKENLNINSENLIDMKMANELIEKQKLAELNKQIVEHSDSPDADGQFFVFQALDALINTAEVYANALKKQIEEYEKRDYNLEESNKYSHSYKRKVKIYEAVLESIKDIREMGLSDYKTLEKLYFSDMKGEENYEDNISNLLISVKYIMQELVLNVDEQEVLPQILTLNKNTNILLSKMNGHKFKDNVLEQYKKVFEENHLNSGRQTPVIKSISEIQSSSPPSLPSLNHSNKLDLEAQPPSAEDNHKNRHEAVLPPLPPPPPSTSAPVFVEKTVVGHSTAPTSDIPEMIEPECLKMVNQNIKKFLKDYKMEDTNKKIKMKKSSNEKPSSSNIELKIEYENEEVKNRIEKMSKSDNELLNSTEDILLELILKSQENQELKTKLISNCLNFDINLAKRLAHSLRMKGKDKEKLKSIKKSEIHQSEETKLKNKMNNGNNENVEITLIDGEVIIKKH